MMRLQDKLFHPNEWTRLAALNAAAARKKPPAPETLEAVLLLGSINTAMRAASLYAAWHPERTKEFVADLIRRIARGDGGMNVILAAVQLYPHATGAFSRALEEGPRIAADAAADVLYYVRDPAQARRLIARAETERRASRPSRSFLNAIGALSGAASRRFFLDLLESRKALLEEALSGLSNSARPEDWSRIAPFLKSRDRRIANKAVFAAGCRAMRNAMKDLTSIAKPDATVCWALGEIGDPAALPYFDRTFGGMDGPARESALISAGLLGGKKARTWIERTASGPAEGRNNAFDRALALAAPDFSWVPKSGKGLLLILEPHCDDACFSAWSRLRRARENGGSSMVLTVFSRSAVVRAPVAKEVREKTGLDGEPFERELTRIRNAESTIFAGKMGAHTVFLDLWDSGRRHYQHVNAAPRAGEIRALRRLLKRQIAALGRRAAVREIYFPAAVGSHVDHRAVFDAAYPLAAAGLGGVRWRCYADQPYLQFHEELEKRENDLKRRMGGAFRSEIETFSPARRGAKARDCRIFDSQSYGNGGFVTECEVPGLGGHGEIFYRIPSARGR